MTTLAYYGQPHFYFQYLEPYLPKDLPLARLYPFFYFSISCVVLRTLLPLTIILFIFRKKPSEYGYRLKGTYEFAWGYIVLFILVLPFVIYASNLSSFQEKYPFGNEVLIEKSVPVQDFIVYQAFYGLVFISGESYWRGFVLFGLEKRFGYFSILIMIIPYCMSHFGKPVAEVYGSILAGAILGFLALKHRSFWLGVILHWSVAITMDMFAIYNRGIEFI